jgi:hypothetical protein
MTTPTLDTLGRFGDWFTKSPKRMGLTAGLLVTAPIIAEKTQRSYQQNEGKLMDIRRDPSRVVTASLETFLEKKASQCVFTKYASDIDFAGDLGSSAISGFGKEVGKGAVNFLTGVLGAGAGAVRDVLVTNRRRQALFDSILRSDPIIQDSLARNPVNQAVLKEAYGTMTRFAPELSQDPNAARSFLREAVLGGAGVNYATIKNLVDTERSIQQLNAIPFGGGK